MRSSATLLFILIFFDVFGDQFTVFEKDGRFGIRDDQGEVTVPPVYEKLGWSDGSSQVHGNVIGFLEGKLWGLITARNKALTEEKFYTIQPFENGLVKASVKGRFSNQLFHGLLDNQGKIVISFHYFSISKMGQHLLVSEYENGKENFGLLSLRNTRLIPNQYHQITTSNGFYLARTADYHFDLYNEQGTKIESSVDSLSYSEGWKCFKNGQAGFIDKNGTLQYDFRYKNFEHVDGVLLPVPFPKWGVFREEKLLWEVEADSLESGGKDLWIIYLNGAHHLSLPDSIKIDKELRLRDAIDGLIVLEHSKTNKFSVQDLTGNELLSNYDSILLGKRAIWAKREGSWKLFNRFGRSISKRLVQQVEQGLPDQFIVKVNNHWGIVDVQGIEITSFKFDSISLSRTGYKINYLNKWGIMSRKGVWRLKAEFAEVYEIDDWFIGRKGYAYTLFKEGLGMIKMVNQPVEKLGDFLLVKSREGKFGLINSYGEFASYPVYNSIFKWGNYVELRSDQFNRVISASEQLIFDESAEIQRVEGIGEGFFLIQKNNRWGFIDLQGRLRISNRYEGAKPFSDGLAAVKLRGKWAFIDQKENLVIQPHYQYVSGFKNGFSIVSTEKGKGLIDSSGNEVLKIGWKDINHLPSGNYIVKDNRGKLGLVSSEGQFLFRPAFESIGDYGDKVIVTQNGSSGLLDYAGHDLIKVAQKEIKIFDDYTVVKY